MIDQNLVQKKLAYIETCVRELRELAQIELFSSDIREERFILHTLQLATQAALDVSSHIISDDRLGEPTTNVELFDILEKNSYLDSDIATTMRSIVGFRNILVHGYLKVNPDIVVDIVRNKLDELLRFTVQIRKKL
jgi:uncharacterized protein YutE (UPF0331/DUF86 family)